MCVKLAPCFGIERGPGSLKRPSSHHPGILEIGSRAVLVWNLIAGKLRTWHSLLELNTLTSKVQQLW